MNTSAVYCIFGVGFYIGSHLCVCCHRVVVVTFRAETLSDGTDSRAFIEEHIEDADVMVFAKSYCGVSDREGSTCTASQRGEARLLL